MNEEGKPTHHLTDHEDRDIPVNAIGKAVAVIAVFLVVVHFLIWFLYQEFVSEKQLAKQPPAKEKTVEEKRVLVEPELQTHPKRDLQEYLAEQKKHLESYGWVSQEKGIAHMPIEKAMHMVAEEN